jgi:hypothetical protein
LLKIQRCKNFNGNGHLKGVRYAAPYGDHFESKMAEERRKNNNNKI